MPDKINYDLAVLSPGEKLWLRRRSWGRTQRQEAVSIRVNHSYYGMMEADALAAPPNILRSLPRSIKLDGYEMLRLARRRSGLELNDVARKNGVSHVTLLRWEEMATAKLVNFWAARGFRFVK